MCGIAGTLSLDGRLGEEELDRVAAMTALLRHRGPDGERVVADARAALGNTRLRVTDPSAAADLPMLRAGGGLWLAFNGAITNFRELAARHRLAERRPLESGSDAEVVLRLYEQKGLGLLDELSGMYAFCLYDRSAGKAWLARDPHGQRPLFYALSPGRLHFASEIKALLEQPRIDRRLDQTALWDYFSLGYIPGEATPFTGVRELRGGCLLEVDLRAGSWERRRFHTLRVAADESLGEEESALKLRGLLERSLARALDCDVPVGVTLSGGIDSSSLLALAARARPRPHSFSLRVDEPSFDESRYQRRMVAAAGSVHHEIVFRPEEVLEHARTCLAHLDEPTANGAVIPSFLIAREARKHVPVLLSGEGGDELFSAYETHRVVWLRALYRRLFGRGARALARRAAGLLPTTHAKLSLDFLLKRFIEGAELDLPAAHLYWRHALSEADKARLLPGSRVRPTDSLFAEVAAGVGGDDLARVAAIDLTYYFIDDLMVKNDRTFMAHSVEARFPYMDRDVVEFALRLPSRFKVRRLGGRLIQKRAMRDLLPPEILGRSNMGLETPYSAWLVGPLRGLADLHFSRERLARSGVIDPEALSALWAEHRAYRRDNGRGLWCALNFLIWFDLFVHDGDYKKHLAGARSGRPPVVLVS